MTSLDQLARERAAEAGPRLGRDDLAGRLVELSGAGAAATLSAAVGLVLDAQEDSEPAAWISLGSSGFFPPDLADSGVDLDALVVIRVMTDTAALRAAEQLLRSGAFGLLILDFTSSIVHAPRGARSFLPLPRSGGGTWEGVPPTTEISSAQQGKLVTLAKAHDAAIVCLTHKPSDHPSLGSLVSLRVEALRRRRDDGFVCAVRAIKDKRRGPGWSQDERLVGPAGMR